MLNIDTVTSRPARAILKPQASPHWRPITRRALAVLLAGALATGAHAADGTWSNATSGGTWSDTTNWTSGAVADGIDATANFATLDIAATNTVTLDTSRSLGFLVFGDVTPTNNWSVVPMNGGNVLTLATSTGQPTITVNNQTATFTPVISGTQGFVKNGPGTLTLAGFTVSLPTSVVTASSQTVTVTSTNGLAVGMGISGGTLIPAGSTITGIPDATDITISLTATSTGTATLSAFTNGDTWTGNAKVNAGTLGINTPQASGVSFSLASGATLTSNQALSPTISVFVLSGSSNYTNTSTTSTPQLAGNGNITFTIGNTTTFNENFFSNFGGVATPGNNNGFRPIQGSSGGFLLAPFATLNFGTTTSSITARNGTATFVLGGLAGTSTGINIFTAGSGGTVNYVIGSANSSTSWAGLFGSSSTNSASTFTKIGTGTLTVNPISAYGAPTIGSPGFISANGGTLKADYSNTTTGIFNAGSPLTFGGGTLTLLAKNSSTTAQTMANVTVNAGGGRLVVDTNGGSGFTLTTGTLTASAAGGSLNIRTSGTGTVAITTLTGTSSGGTYGGRITFTDPNGNTDWATSTSASSPFTISAYSGYSPFVDSGGTGDSNRLLTNGSAVTATESFLSLKIVTTTSGQALDLGTNALTLVNGGLLFTGSQDYSINNGTLNSGLGATNSDLIVQQFGTGNLTIGALIANGTGNSTLTKAGTGKVTLTGANTYTGATFLNNGITSISANGNLGLESTGAAVNLNTGTLQATATFGLFNGIAGTNNRNVVLYGGGGTIDVTAGNNLTISGTVSNVNTSNIGPLIKSGSGTLTLAGLNTYMGATIISGGVLSVNTLANGGVFLANNASNTTAAASPNVTVSGTNGLAVGQTVIGNNIPAGTTISSFASATSVVLSANATLTGQTTLDFYTPNSLGSSPSTANALVLDGGTLQYTGPAQSTDRSFTVTPNSGGIDASGIGALAFSNTVPVVVSGSGARTLTLTGSNTDLNTLSATLEDGTAGATSLTKSGPGTWLIAGANTFSGTTLVGAGTLIIGDPLALQNSLLTIQGGTFSFGSQTSAFIGGLSGTTSLVLTNSNAAAVALTLGNNNGNATFSGFLSGLGSLTKTGTGTLTFTSTNSYAGGTTINGGALKANNSTGSATGSGGVAVNSGATLTGTGRITGLVTVASNGRIVPGNSGIGTLTLGALTIQTGSLFDYEFGAGNDLINVTGNSGLTINGGILNLYQAGTTTPFTTTGTFNLFRYVGSIGGAGPSALTLSSSQSGLGYTFGTAVTGGTNFVTLQISQVSPLFSWVRNSDGLYSTGTNWSASGGIAPPNVANAVATFGTSITAPRTVTLDINATVGALIFSSSNGYTIANGGGSFSFNFGAGQGAITVTNGTNTIAAPVSFTSNGFAVAVNDAANSLIMSGPISGSGGLVKSGSGNLSLTNTNTYTGGTIITGGIVRITNTNSLGDESNAVTINDGTLEATEDITSSRNISLGSLNSSIHVDLARTYALNGVLTNLSGTTGALVKNGSGTLALNGSNSYSGGTTINAGTIQINSPDSMGVSSGGLVLNSGTVEATTTIVSTRNIQLGSATSTILVSGSNYSVGALSGSGNLTKNGVGTLTLTALSNAATGSTTLNDGGLILSAQGVSSLPSGNVTMNGTSSITIGAVNQSFNFPGNQLIINGTNSITETNSVTLTIGKVTGSGKLTLVNPFVTDFGGDITGFLGTFRLPDTTTRFNGSPGSSLATFDLGDGSGSMSHRSGSTTLNLGALTGGSNTTLSGAGGSGNTVSVTYVIGANGMSTRFDGRILNGASPGTTSIIKSGTGTLLLTSTASTYTGTTTVTSGTLKLGDPGALGATSGLVVNGGTFDLNGLTTTNALQISGTGGLITTSAAAALVLTVNETVESTFAGAIRDGAGLLSFIKSGTGGLALTASNNYSGGTTVNVGAVKVNNPFSLGALSGTATINGGIIEATSSISTSRTFALGADNSGITVDSGATYSLTGLVRDGDAAGTLNKDGVGILALTGSNTYTGGTTIKNGVLQVNTTASMGANSGVATITSGTVEALNSIISTRNFKLGSTTSGIMVDSGATYTFNGTVSDGDNAGSLNKVGPGTLVLNTISSYTGDTKAAGGTLIVSAGLAGTSSLAATNGTLRLGNNNVLPDTAPVTLTTGVIEAAGRSDTVGSLTLAGAGNSVLDLGGPSVFRFADSSANTWSGSLTIKNWSGSSTGGGADQVYFGNSSSGLLSSQIAQISFLNPIVNGTQQTGLFPAGDLLASGELVPVPEPSAWILLAISAGLLFAARRKRRLSRLV